MPHKSEATKKPEITGCIFIGNFKLMKAPNAELYIEDKRTEKAKVLSCHLFEKAIEDFFLENCP